MTSEYIKSEQIQTTSIGEVLDLVFHKTHVEVRVTESDGDTAYLNLDAEKCVELINALVSWKFN